MGPQRFQCTFNWFCWALTNSPSFPQTELGINTHTTVVNTHGVVVDTHGVVASTHGVVMDTHGVVAGTHGVVADTHGLVADIHRKVFAGPGGTQARSAVVNIIGSAV